MGCRDMVTSNRIAKIAKKSSPGKINLDHTLSFGVSCYESGMIEVLRGIAVQEFEKEADRILLSNYSKKMTEVLEGSYRELESVLDQSEKELLNKLDEVFHILLSAESGDHFIAGFIQGYRYLKNHLTFNNSYEIEEDVSDES